jgi:hypothetical protein
MKKKRFILWGVYNPEGKLITVNLTKWDAKVVVFDSHENFFRSKYWHKATPAWNAAKKEGWRIVKGYFAEVIK